MGIDSALHLLGLTLEILLLDLLLSGDNAVVIALACRRLAPEQRSQVLAAGTGIAVVLRVLLALLASLLLRLPLLKLVGGVALAAIAVRLLVDDGDDAEPAAGARLAHDAASALRTVVIADVVMSVDNVMALSALAHGSIGVLAAGVALSVPLLMFGSWLVARVIANYPLIEPLGAALLGWIAGSSAVSDPLYARWLEAQSPLLSVVVPALTAAYVLVQARIVRERRPRVAALRPAPVPRAQPVAAPAPVRAAEPVPAPVQVPEPAAASQTAVTVAPAEALAPAPTPGPAMAAAPAMASAGAMAPAAAAMPAPAIAPAAAATPAPAMSPLAATMPARATRAPAPARRAPAGFPAAPWLAGGGVLAAGTALVAILYAGHGSSPALLQTYDCGPGVIVSYLPGSPRIRLWSGPSFLDGTVGAGNRIEWKPQAPGAAPLAIAPPQFITYGDATTLGLGGSGAGPDLACKLR